MLNSFYPVVAGRTSDSQSRYRTLYQVQAGKIGITRLQDELATGKRILAPSDDPTAAIRVIGLQREQEFRDQALVNLQSSIQFLNATEANLVNIQNVITDMRGLSVAASSNVISDEERQGMLTEINSSINRLISTTNTKYQDRYLFSGGSVATSTVALNRDLVQFQGNDNSLLSIADDGQYMTHNVTGQKALGLMSTSVVSTANLSPAPVASTRLADLNLGNGVSPGAIGFTDGVETVTVDTANASSIKDILDKVNGKVKLSGRDVTLSLQSNGTLSVNYADGLPGVLRISDVGTGQTATELGIATNVPAPTLPIDGGKLNPILRLTTKLSQLIDGAGFNATEGFRITQGNRNYTITIGTAETIEDVFNAIHRSGASIRADITPDGQSIRLRSTESGSDFSIGENGGQLAERLGIRTLTAQTRLDQLNHGRGVSIGDGAEIVLTRSDGTTFSVDLTGSTTMQDVIDKVNSNVQNQTAALKITMSLNSVGNGLTLSSPPAPAGTATPVPISIYALRGSQAAWDLGLIPPGLDRKDGVLSLNGSQIVGTDPNPQEVRGVFNSLLRLREALTKNDAGQIARASNLLEEDLDRLSGSRGSLGISLQQIDDLQRNHEDRQNELKSAESLNLDADMASVITELNARQVAYEAGLKLLANNSKLSIFDYI